MLDVQGMGSGILVENLIQTATERGILVETDAPDEELKTVQGKIDQLSEEVLRRMSW